ncbi:hypothetical protein [Streptomyces pacificus]|uniref:Uncharacterized protein n=1 Tax=Streptomyces pacificus TaxID=2705029 RepID=A0A6A0B2T2_9ACTN|nr:hypothetical protein [Streptomyces pacificus]GFH38828.1 hypothetical protein SCWH03_50890 [Streptomyces pacificus]
MQERDQQDREQRGRERGREQSQEQWQEQWQEQEETDTGRRLRRAQFLRDLHEAKALRDRVQPRRARAARMRQAMRMRSFRW